MTLMVTMSHARRARIAGAGVQCAPGIRLWFARYGLDYRRFVREGLPADTLRDTGDPFALKAVALAEKEAATHGR